MTRRGVLAQAQVDLRHLGGLWLGIEELALDEAEDAVEQRALAVAERPSCRIDQVQATSGAVKFQRLGKLAMLALEAFKDDQVDWRSENSAKDWATA